jgi:hypothetical protein
LSSTKLAPLVKVAEAAVADLAAEAAAVAVMAAEAAVADLAGEVAAVAGEAEEAVVTVAIAVAEEAATVAGNRLQREPVIQFHTNGEPAAAGSPFPFSAGLRPGLSPGGSLRRNKSLPLKRWATTCCQIPRSEMGAQRVVLL